MAREDLVSPGEVEREVAAGDGRAAAEARDGAGLRVGLVPRATFCFFWALRLPGLGRLAAPFAPSDARDGRKSSSMSSSSVGETDRLLTLRLRSGLAECTMRW